ncbi:hypothetical protein HPP92_018558 [Vanilla planifolia]|uniref:Uncharacterized protein n=1 Tax=Vanilla planifolia TaxID=51239 RepID=A0A835QEE0_VANPL|nr:hypothetical protein HPP92_019177 [Vanilla planifolia]KAG0469230.1 hypothetical protein HPP92_018558 [Vanilla planifolia]
MDFRAMRRKDLQKLCKKYGLRANSRNSQMADSLASLLQINLNDEKIEVCSKTFGVSAVCEGGKQGEKPKKVSYVLHEEDELCGVSKSPNGKSLPKSRRSSRRLSKVCHEDLAEEFAVSVRNAKSDALNSSAVCCSVIEHNDTNKSGEVPQQSAGLDLRSCMYEGKGVEAGNEILTLMPRTRTSRRKNNRSYPMKVKDEVVSILTAVSHTETLDEGDAPCGHVSSLSSIKKVAREVIQARDEQENSDDVEGLRRPRRRQRHNLSKKEELRTTGNSIALLHRRTEKRGKKKRTRTSREELHSVNFKAIDEAEEIRRADATDDNVKELIDIYSTMEFEGTEGLQRNEDEHEMTVNHAKEFNGGDCLLSPSGSIGLTHVEMEITDGQIDAHFTESSATVFMSNICSAFVGKDVIGHRLKKLSVSKFHLDAAVIGVAKQRDDEAVVALCSQFCTSNENKNTASFKGYSQNIAEKSASCLIFCDTARQLEDGSTAFFTPNEEQSVVENERCLSNEVNNCDNEKSTAEPQAVEEDKEIVTANLRASMQDKMEGVAPFELEERFDNIMKKLVDLNKLLRGETSPSQIASTMLRENDGFCQQAQAQAIDKDAIISGKICSTYEQEHDPVHERNKLNDWTSGVNSLKKAYDFDTTNTTDDVQHSCIKAEEIDAEDHDCDSSCIEAFEDKPYQVRYVESREIFEIVHGVTTNAGDDLEMFNLASLNKGSSITDCSWFSDKSTQNSNDRLHFGTSCLTKTPDVWSCPGKQENFYYPGAQLALKEHCDRSQPKMDGFSVVTPVKRSGQGLGTVSDSTKETSHNSKNICISSTQKTTKFNIAGMEIIRDKENLQKPKLNCTSKNKLKNSFSASSGRRRLQRITNQMLE